MVRKFIIVLIFGSLSFLSQAQENEVDSLGNRAVFQVDEAGLDSGKVFTFWGIYFGLGSYNLIDSSFFNYSKDLYDEFSFSNKERLNALANYLLENPGYVIEISVHTDCRGSKKSCRLLSQRRAQTICDELEKLGVQKSRVIPKGYEDSMPYNYNGNLLTCAYINRFSPQERDELHQKNRRYEVRLLSRDYVPLEEGP